MYKILRVWRFHCSHNCQQFLICWQVDEWNIDCKMAFIYSDKNNSFFFYTSLDIYKKKKKTAESTYYEVIFISASGRPMFLVKITGVLFNIFFNQR